MFNRIIIRIRKYIQDKLINSEIKRLIREKAALNEEFDSYVHDASTAMDLLCEDKRVLQEKVKKLEQEASYYKAHLDRVRKDFANREGELMGMVGRAEANCRIAEARRKALDDALHEYVAKLATECGDCALKLRAEDDLK